MGCGFNCATKKYACESVPNKCGGGSALDLLYTSMVYFDVDYSTVRKVVVKADIICMGAMFLVRW